MNQQKKIESNDLYWELPYQCKKCNCRFENQSLMQKHAKTHVLLQRLDTINYRGRIIRFAHNVKTGICAACGSTDNTALHHIAYHDEDPLKDTLELCTKCRGNWHQKNTDGWGTAESKLW